MRDTLWRRHADRTPWLDLDPREPWEQDIDEATARAQAPTGLRGFPYRPRRLQDIPDGALAALRDAVRAEGMGNLLVVPPQARPARSGRSRTQLLTPASVLGFGPYGAALWVGPPTARPGVQVVVPAQHVSAVETVHILLYARLTIRAAGAWLTVRYNAVADRELRPLVQALRRRTADALQDLPATPALEGGLPYKWRRLLTSDEARLDDGEPMAAVAGRLPTSRRADPAYAAVVLTPHELIVLADPVHADPTGGHYGLDSHYLPRAGVEQLHADGPLLRIRVRGTDLAMPLGEQLANCAVDTFARYLPMVASGGDSR